MHLSYNFQICFCLLIGIKIASSKLHDDDDDGFCPADTGDIPTCGGTTGDVEVVDNGGWSTDLSTMIASSGPCSIDVLESLSQEDFINKYAYKAPFIVKNPNDNSKFRDHSRRENMLKEFGERRIRLSSANTFSYKKLDVTLRHYIEKIMKPQSLNSLGNETFYWFGDNNHTEWKEIFDSYRPPQLRIPRLEPAYSYGVAGAGTGVPFHFHGPGFSEVIFGSKRWFLYPPHEAPKFDPNATTLHWLVKEYPHFSSDRLPLECTIKPGEALYFPDHWWHATLNIHSSVFISTFLG